MSHLTIVCDVACWVDMIGLCLGWLCLTLLGFCCVFYFFVISELVKFHEENPFPTNERHIMGEDKRYLDARAHSFFFHFVAFLPSSDECKLQRQRKHGGPKSGYPCTSFGNLSRSSSNHF